MPNEREILRTMTFSAYDLQMLRIQTGLRLCANFRSKLNLLATPGDQEGDAEPVDDERDAEKKEAEKVIDKLRQSYARLTDGVARNRTIPAEKGFTGDELITNYTELVLVDQYMRVEQNERAQFRQFESVLNTIPIYTEFLRQEVGIGPAMAAVLISYFDPHRAERISDFWAYAGLDVAPDGLGRSRRQEHLIDREYTNKEGKQATRKSVTYNPWLKSRLLGALATSFMRQKGCRWRVCYDQYKHRILSDPNRIKITSAEFKALYKTAPMTARRDRWSPLRIHRAALRFMIKMFLIELWTKWRELEGLPVTKTYHEEKLGYRHVA
jgi:hypothetical protein